MQSRHSDIKTLMRYIQPTEEETKNEYLKGMSFDDDTPPQDVKPIQPTSPKSKDKPEINNTDIYIALIEKINFLQNKIAEIESKNIHDISIQ